MTLRLITAPATEPVSLAEAKLHLRVDGTDEDTLISALVSAARQMAEHELRRSLITQTWERVLDSFPRSEIELGVPPVQSIVSITYADASGLTQVLNGSAYVVDNVREPGWVLPASGYSWPETFDSVNAVKVRFTAGYGAAAAVPESVKAWIKLTVGALYENRESIVTREGATSVALAQGFVGHLLDAHRVYSV